jgi:carbonic anhydrase
MTMVDMDNRWVYKGSVTTPPCDRMVYWNVVRKVYPIKQKHLEAFKEQLRRKGENDLYKTGNWRLI